MILTKAQENAIAAGRQWYQEASKTKQVWTLSGVAGSGKSTIIDFLIQELRVAPSRVLYCAYTGAAVQVLRMKGLPANTIHNSIYNFSKADGKYQKTRKLVEELENVSLFVVDEASMVPQDILEDILSYRKPVILVGDGNQLPPVESGENYYIGRPDIRLTEPIRQAMDNSIIAMAWNILQGKLNPAPGKYGENVTVKRSMHIDDLMTVDQVLTRTNYLRCRINKLMRKQLGHTAELPQIGERLVCRKNNWEKMVSGDMGTMFMVNGLSLTAATDFNDGNEYQQVTPRFWPGSDNFIGKIDPDTIQEDPDVYKKWFKWPREKEAEYLYLTYGYAVTGHAMQGSEVDTILFNNENISKGTAEETKKWLYTCITRARKHAIWVW